jgi:hypothetical protein
MFEACKDIMKPAGKNIWYRFKKDGVSHQWGKRLVEIFNKATRPLSTHEELKDFNDATQLLTEVDHIFFDPCEGKEILPESPSLYWDIEKDCFYMKSPVADDGKTHAVPNYADRIDDVQKIMALEQRFKYETEPLFYAEPSVKTQLANRDSNNIISLKQYRR